MMTSKTCQLNLKPVHPDQVEEIIRVLKNSGSCGLDSIDARTLKLGKDYIVPAITHIVNLSISTQTFPEDWKVSRVIPLHKKKDQNLPKNYRPVSLLSSVSKILERAIFLQIIEYFESNGLLHPSHQDLEAGIILLPH